MLEAAHVDLVLDVGANDGGYATALRRLGYHGDIVSFEPLSQPWEDLERRCRNDPRWRSIQRAVGAEPGVAQMHVAANDGASSSLLPMLDRHVQAAPEARYVGVETVEVVTVDSVTETIIGDHQRVFLKVDVQGYEREVLDGAKALLASSVLMGLQLEMSLVPLYEDAWLWKDLLDHVEQQGFTLRRMIPGFSDPATSEMLQADGIFMRD
jgi:FkbM family methyltransferase